MRKQAPKQLRKGFDTFVTLAVWEVWKERSSRVFRNKSAPIDQVVGRIWEECMQWRIAGAKCHGIFLVRSVVDFVSVSRSLNRFVRTGF